MHAALAAVALLAAGDLATHAEKTAWKETGRYAEVERLCAAFQEAHPKKAQCRQFGRTPEGRPMLALILSGDGTFDAAAARKLERPVVLLQGGIHAGEIDGKDAGFLVARELLEGKINGGILDKVVTVFVPVFNVDGHERFGANNRPNQVGPKEMGWRVTAQNLNLNRDYAKADAPEMQAMLRLLGEWDPIVYMDLHVTDGAKFQHAVAFLVEPTTSGPQKLRNEALGFRDAAVAKLEKQKHLPIGEFYPAFEKDDDPNSGFGVYAAPPRFSTAYWGLRNRIGVLVETHSWKDYATRVRATRDSIVATLELAATKGRAWRAAADEADRETAALGGTEVALVHDANGKTKTIEFQGYAWRQESSEVSGGTRILYDTTKPQVWKVPVKYELQPVVTTRAPRGGYVVPPAHAAWMAERLRIHGIEFRTVEKARPALAVESFRASSPEFGAAPYEGRQTLKARGGWAADTQEIAAGSLFVPIAQAKARLVLQLLEPAGPDSFLAWGFFNAHFERKEYMEAYVAEEVAREMLKDPAVKKEFDARVAADPDFAKSAEKRLEFFYRRHPSWDSRMNVYPICRVDGAP